MNEPICKPLYSPTDMPLKFWLKYWNSRVKEFCDLDDYEIQLNSPHFLLLEILSEIEYNDLGNKDNGAYLKSNWDVF